MCECIFRQYFLAGDSRSRANPSFILCLREMRYHWMAGWLIIYNAQFLRANLANLDVTTFNSSLLALDTALFIARPILWQPFCRSNLHFLVFHGLPNRPDSLGKSVCSTVIVVVLLVYNASFKPHRSSIKALEVLDVNRAQVVVLYSSCLCLGASSDWFLLPSMRRIDRPSNNWMSPSSWRLRAAPRCLYVIHPVAM